MTITESTSNEGGSRLRPTLLDLMQGFVHELRAVGLPVSMTENLDAMRAIEHVELDDREQFRAALAATMVKHHRHRAAFDTVFNVYFSLFSQGIADEALGEGGDVEIGEDGTAEGEQGRGQGQGGGEGLSREDLAAMLIQALMNMDQDAMRQLAALAVQQYAGMEPGRQVGGTYYLYRTLRQLDLEDLQARLLAGAHERGEVAEGELADRLAREEFEARLALLPRHDRGSDPAGAGRRPRRGGDGAHTAQAVARGHRVHARVARGDGDVAAGRLSAHPCARGTPRAAAPASQPGPSRLPQDGPGVAVVRGRAGRAQVPQPAPVEARGDGHRRHLGLGGELRRASR